MDVWQRGAGPITVGTAGAYTADGCIVVPTGASVTAQQVSGRGPTVYSLKVAGAPSVTDVIVKQRIESYVAAPLTGQTVTVQARVFNNTGATITPNVTVKHAGAQDNWTSPTTDVSATPLQSCANAAWTQIAYTFTASSSSSAGLEISFDFGNNFGASANSIQITEIDIRVTPGVATGVNGAPPTPELRPIGSELALCQRYLQVFGGHSTYEYFGVAMFDTSTQGHSYINFLTEMRWTPTITYAAASNFVMFPAGTVATAIVNDTVGPQGLGVTLTISGGTAGQAQRLQANNSTAAIIQVSAEL